MVNELLGIDDFLSVAAWSSLCFQLVFPGRRDAIGFLYKIFGAVERGSFCQPDACFVTGLLYAALLLIGLGVPV